MQIIVVSRSCSDIFNISCCDNVTVWHSISALLYCRTLGWSSALVNRAEKLKMVETLICHKHKLLICQKSFSTPHTLWNCPSGAPFEAPRCSPIRCLSLKHMWGSFGIDATMLVHYPRFQVNIQWWPCLPIGGSRWGDHAYGDQWSLPPGASPSEWQPFDDSIHFSRYRRRQ